MILDTFDFKETQSNFLQMFLAEIKFSDPLEPKGTEHLSQQISNFAMIEQMHNMNSNLGDIKSTVVPRDNHEMLVDNMNRYSSFMNKNINADKSHIYLDGDDARVSFSLDQSVANMEVKIFNELNDQLVKTQNMNDLEAGEYTILWDGTNNKDETVSAGRYRVQFEASNTDGTDCNNYVQDLQGKKVQGIKVVNEQVYLLLDNDTLVHPNNITDVAIL